MVLASGGGGLGASVLSGQPARTGDSEVPKTKLTPAGGPVPGLLHGSHPSRRGPGKQGGAGLGLRGASGCRRHQGGCVGGCLTFPQPGGPREECPHHSACHNHVPEATKAFRESLGGGTAGQALKGAEGVPTWQGTPLLSHCVGGGAAGGGRCLRSLLQPRPKCLALAGAGQGRWKAKNGHFLSSMEDWRPASPCPAQGRPCTVWGNRPWGRQLLGCWGLAGGGPVLQSIHQGLRRQDPYPHPPIPAIPAQAPLLTNVAFMGCEA